MAFEVVVLGASGTFPTPDSACSGFLLRTEGKSIWVDAGPGTLANLQRHISFRKVDALVLSHLHSDHVLDVYAFFYALRFALEPGPSNVDAFAPDGVEEHLIRLLLTSDPVKGFGDFLNFDLIASGVPATIAGMNFSFATAIHPVPTLSMRIEAEGSTLVYSADSAPTDDLVELARGADTFICEATLQDPNPELARIHMTAHEAGETAERAGAKKLVLTHIWPGLDHRQSARLAAEKYSGEILVASDNLKIPVSGPG